MLNNDKRICASCEQEWGKDDKKCPHCGHGTLLISQSRSSNSQLMSDIGETISDIALAGIEIIASSASAVAEVTGKTFESIGDIDFGGAGVGGLFD